MDRIRFENVSKKFSLRSGRKFFRSHIRDWMGKPLSPDFYAVRDLSFNVRDGEGLAVIGANGAGKSTVLNLATRLCYPDGGRVEVRGRIAAILDLGCGFHADLTGAENLWVTASVLGLTKRRTKEMFEAVVDFAELGEFINEPLSVYSSGMVARLAFSIAIQADPEILLIDEVLAVGDAAFQAKCFDRMSHFRRAGTTILCVSHSPELLRHVCNKAILLDHGRLIASGPLNSVLDDYAERTSLNSGARPR